MKRRLIIITGAVVAVLVVVAGVDYFLPDKPSPAESPPAQQPAPTGESETPPAQPAPAVTSEPPPTFEQKIEDLIEAVVEVARTGESREVTVIFTEAEANDKGAELLTQTEIPADIPLEIKDVHIDFKTDNKVFIDIDTVISYGFSIEVTIKVKTQVSIKEGKPAVEVTDVNFGFVPLPGAIKERITGLIQQKTEDIFDQMTRSELGAEVDLEFKDINIQEETATITLLIKPIE